MFVEEEDCDDGGVDQPTGLGNGSDEKTDAVP